MPLNPYQEQLVDELSKRVKALENFAKDIRTTQTKELRYGNILLDAANGEISISNALSEEIIELSANGMTIKIPNSTASLENSFVFFQRAGANVGKLVSRRYTPAFDEVSDMIFRSFHSSKPNRNTYVTLDIYDGGLRDAFFQINSYYQAGIFQSASLNFAKQGASGTFYVTMTNTSGNGFMVIPRAASDPSGTAGLVDGAMYYNTATNKFRGLVSGVWTDLH